jgi:hypothetical protein
MSDDLDNRKQQMWNMEEVRSGDTDIDNPDTADDPDTKDVADTADSSDTVDTTDTKDKVDREDTADTTDTIPEAPPDASIRELFLASQEQGLTVADLRNVNVYLFDRVHGEMNDLLAEVNYRAMKQRGEEVQMNKEFFNAIYRVAARHEDEVLAELELEA